MGIILDTGKNKSRNSGWGENLGKRRFQRGNSGLEFPGIKSDGSRGFSGIKSDGSRKFSGIKSEGSSVFPGINLMDPGIFLESGLEVKLLPTPANIWIFRDGTKPKNWKTSSNPKLFPPSPAPGSSSRESSGAAGASREGSGISAEPSF